MRSYLVVIKAKNSDYAKRLAEFYVGYSDLSTLEERNKCKFHIDEIEMTVNEAMESELLESELDGLGDDNQAICH